MRFSSSTAGLMLGITLLSLLAGTAIIVILKYYSSLAATDDHNLRTAEYVMEQAEKEFLEQESLLDAIAKSQFDSRKNAIGPKLNEINFGNKEVLYYAVNVNNEYLLAPPTEASLRKEFEQIFPSQFMQLYKELGTRLIFGKTYWNASIERWVLPIGKEYMQGKSDNRYFAWVEIDINSIDNPWRYNGLESETVVLVAHPPLANTEYHLIYYARPDSMATSTSDLYNNPVYQPFIDVANRKVLQLKNKLVKDLRFEDGFVQYTNDTRGLPDARSTVRFNDEVGYVIGVRTFTESLIKDIFTFIIFVIPILLVCVIVVFYVARRLYLNDLQYKQRLQNLATKHGLTGLYNRNHLAKTFSNWKKLLGYKYSVFCFDLDDFKLINDRYGRALGDKVIKVVAHRLEEFVGSDDLLIHYDGDQFLIFSLLIEKDACRQYAQDLQSVISDTMLCNDIKLNVTVSVGIFICKEFKLAYTDSELNAEIAMYEAKKRSPGIAFFSHEVKSKIEQKAEMQVALKKALTNNELSLVYQPQICAFTGEIIGVEALMRWNSSQFGFVSPAVFIPLAESSGLIIDLGKLCIEIAMSELADLLKEKDLTLSINASATLLLDENFDKILLKKIKEHDIPPSSIIIEVTENVFIDKPKEFQKVVEVLNIFGIQLSLDDFGTGYSSLSMIKDFNLNELKVDKAFVDNITVSDGDAYLVLQIISIAKSRDIQVVVEGVETAEQNQLLRTLGADVLQGYYHARPLAIEQLLQFIKQHDAHKAIAE